jgi:hypothetical protein
MRPGAGHCLAVRCPPIAKALPRPAPIRASTCKDASRAENLRPAFVEHRQLNTVRPFHITLVGERSHYQTKESRWGDSFLPPVSPSGGLWFLVEALG